ncbi:MAG: hypothetical protein KatS3mg102_2738 [Planctomycetota bacterium]|nr:MAG: hypothetical protein KatS3mg102_2738 [Planctomycetota bacterium]
MQALNSKLTALLIALVVLPSTALALASLLAIRSEHEALRAAEERRLQDAAHRLAGALGLRLRERTQALAARLEQAARAGAQAAELARLLEMERPHGYRHAALLDARGAVVAPAAGGKGAGAPAGQQAALATSSELGAGPAGGSEAAGGTNAEPAPGFPEPALRARAVRWMAAAAGGQWAVEHTATGGRRLIFGAPIRAGPEELPLGLALVEPDVERFLAAELELLLPLLGEREQAQFRLVAAEAPPRGLAAGAGQRQPSGSVSELGHAPLPYPLDHLAVAVSPAGAPPRGPLQTLSARLHIWAIAFILAALLVGAGVTTLAVNREVRTAALKSDFVTTVTHELKTPLTSIGMFAETLLMGRVRDEAEQKECLEIIARETERLTRLIDRVLTFSKIEARTKRFDLRLTDLGRLVEETIELFQTQMRGAEAPVQIELAVAHDLPPVLCDRAAMQEVLLNLFSNAYKYSRWPRRASLSSSGAGAPPGGGAPLELRPSGEPGEGEAAEAPPRRIHVTVTKRRRWAMIAVRDWGIGISRREQRKIFRKFYRANDVLTREVDGSGIGLTLARSIMRAHRGDVTVRSRLGHGSTFTIWLPR